MVPPSVPPPTAPAPRLRRRRGRWWALVGAVALGGCGPSLSDRPTDFQGNGELQIAVLCGDETVGATESHSAWIKTTVRARPGTEVDWGTITVSGRNARAVRRAAGRVTDTEDGGKQRILTWWFVSAPVGSSREASLGPIAVDYTAGGTKARMEHGHCPLQIQ